MKQYGAIWVLTIRKKPLENKYIIKATIKQAQEIIGVVADFP